MFQAPPIVRLTLLASIAALALAAPALADPVAVMAAVQGKVQVVPAGGKGGAQRAVFGRALQRGDRVVVGTGGSATVFFSDGNVIELGEKSTVSIGGRVEGRGASALPGEVYSQVSKFVTAGSRQSGLVGMSEMRGGGDEGAPLLTAPRKTSILEATPSFRWRPVEGVSRYRVSVSSAEGGELWSREVEGVELAYPSDAKPLATETDYLWEVEARSGTRTLRRESTVFHVASPVLAERVRGHLTRITESAGGADAPAARFLAGSYLSGLGLYRDAAEHFTALCKLAPESSAPHEALGNVYTRVGLMDLAAAEFQQALTLTREP